MVTRATARKYRLTSIDDLARSSPKLRLGAVAGFDTRADGLPLLQRRYGLQFSSTRTYDPGLRYRALVDRKIDVAYGFETDGQIARNKLVVLRDSREIWPPYFAVPVVRSQRFRGAGGSELRATLDRVSQSLDAQTMRRLNSQVDEQGRDVENVAHDYLVSSGLAAELKAKRTRR